MSNEHAPKKVFDKFIVPGKTKGSIVIRSATSGNLGTLQNPVKEKYIPPELLENLKSIVVVAFPKEFQGAEGAATEQKLQQGIKQRYPTEQPQEVWKRTIATLAAKGVNAEDIAGSLFSINGEVYTALSLGSMSKADQNNKMLKVVGAIKRFWPSSPNLA